MKEDNNNYIFDKIIEFAFERTIANPTGFNCYDLRSKLQTIDIRISMSTLREILRELDFTYTNGMFVMDTISMIKIQ